MANGRGRNLPAYTYFRCRSYGHAWFEYDSSNWNPSFGVPVTLRCERCGSERRDQISRVTGDLVARRYEYAPGYQFVSTEDEPRPTSSAFRLMVLTNNEAERPEQVRARTRAQMRVDTPPEREPSLRRQT